ncbi:choice-of-anchor B family protein [Nafulsella turpanensis]|uniref:choice-of-anchor B family protein n=1 Tax=Nafulsella turpanensis TaxID=1265690 RepID=UPI00135F10C5|nr:choice-of-anchor B family protein [Nafulsella turpanensis]
MDGNAGNYPCSQIDLLAHVGTEELLAEEHDGIWLNDLWGWTDPETGKEYALVGMSNGTSFVDISDPVRPVVLGILPEHHAAEGARKNRQQAGMHEGGKSAWRDIKVYKNHAFIVSEDAGHGMQVFDLTQLRNVTNAPVEFAETANYQGIGKAHNLVINEETGFAYAVGANSPGYDCNMGGLHIINIQDPAKPVFAGCFDADGYTHDAQCVIYKGPDPDYAGQEICFNANEDAITLVDVTDKANPALISVNPYEHAAYAHQGWLTEDHRYFISNDELDEYYTGVNTTSYIWDMQDLDNPVLIGEYVSNLSSIDHNLYIKEAIAYEANYTTGLRVLNISDIKNANLQEIAYFDTHPEDNDVKFKGAWSNYPFFESGVVIVSDITHGLYILQPTLGLVGKEAENVISCEGGQATFQVYPNRFDLTYKWQKKEGESYVDLENGSVYSNVNTPKLRINEISTEMEGAAYRLKMTEADGGESYFSEDASLSLSGMPEAAFEYREENGQVIFTNLSTNGTSYTWDFGDGSEPVEEENPTHQYTSHGPFEVRLEVSNDCGSAVFTQTISPITGIEDKELAEKLEIYPNPAKETLHISYRNSPAKVNAISLYSLSGQRLLHQQLKASQDGEAHQIDVSKLAKGVYYLKLTSEKGIVARRVIVE